MMVHRNLLLVFLFFCPFFVTNPLVAQMVVGQDTLYGNEWIDYDKTYWKIKVAKRDMYRVTYDVLQSGGFPVDQTSGDQYQLFVFGQEVPLYVSTNGNFGPSDYFEFYGDKNKSQLDQHLFEGGRDAMLNPEVSLYTDTAVYFLTTIKPGQSAIRYEQINPPNIPAIPINKNQTDTSRLDFMNWHYSKTYDSDQLVRYSIYEKNEGLATPSIKKTVFTQSTPDIIPDSTSRIQIQLISSITDHHLIITINGIVVLDSINYPSNQVNLLSIDIPGGILQESNTIQIEGTTNNSDRYQIAHSTIFYQRNLLISSDDTKFIDFAETTKINAYSWKSSQNCILYDLQNYTRSELPQSVGEVVLINEPSPYINSYAIRSITSTATNILSIKSVQFSDYSLQQEDYIIISHPKLLSTTMGDNPIDEYKNYRQSETGGSYKVKILMIDQLIDQYAWGNTHHPLAIRNWAAKTHHLQIPIQYVFIVGKGLEYPYVRIQSIDYSERNLISTFGFLGSDNLLASPPEVSAPYFSISRLSASNGNQVHDYLNKVKNYEQSALLPRTISNHRWRTNALHLVGGQSKSEIEGHKQLLAFMENTLTENGTRIHVKTLLGNSTDPVSSSSVQFLIDEINRGVLIKTYLGHGGVTTSGNFSIDDAVILDNDHYPIIFSLGCLTGNVFTPEYSLSEMFTLIPNKGGIAYVASSGYGFSSSLTDFTNEFYKYFGANSWNTGIGDIMRNVRNTFDLFTNPSHQSLADQLNLHGDPAIRLLPDSLPDFTMDPATIQFTPTIGETKNDSTKMSWTLWNIGRPIQNHVHYSIQHTLPDGTIMNYADSIKLTSSFVTIDFTLKKGIQNVGDHRISIQIDPSNLIAEIISGGESNNNLILPDGKDFITYQVVDRRPSLLRPLNFSICDPDSVILNCFSLQNGNNTIYTTFTLDTIPDLSSPIRTSKTVPINGSIAEWKITSSLLPDQVYYWTAAYTLDNGQVITADTIYSFITDLLHDSGWNQSTGYQFNENSLSFLEIDSKNRKFSFDLTYINANARAVILSTSNNVATRVFVNDIRIINSVNDASINIGVINPKNGSVTTTKSFKLNGTDSQRQMAVTFLRDEVPDSSYVIVATFRKPGSDYHLDNWKADSILLGDHIYSILETEGASLIRGFESSGSVPYAFAYQKSIGAIAEAIAAPTEENAYILFDIAIPKDSGTMVTPLIGPSAGWNELEWTANFQKTIASDSFDIQIYGYSDPKSVPVQLVAAAELKEDLVPIDFQTYPYIQLGYRSTSPVQRTPLQLLQWRILYDDVPDLIPSLHTVQTDSILHGATVTIPITIYNVGALFPDSFELQIIHQYPDLTTSTQIIRLNHLGKQDSQLVSIDKQFLNVGKNVIKFNVDPDNLILETNQNNNSASLIFNVLPDLQDPVLQIYFDGVQIIDNSLVQAKPSIEIRLFDNHPYLRLTDTSSIQVALFDPNQSQIPLTYSNSGLIFSAAPPTGPNLAKTNLQPGLLQDGVYTMVVTARDISNNPSPPLQKTIHFRVIHESILKSFTVYPNPSNGNQQIQYTLTGAAIPARAELNIFDAAGKVVMDYTEDDIDPLQIGTHNFTLRLHDSAGNLFLPAGIYFYDFKIWDSAGKLIPISLENGVLPGRLILLDGK